MASRRRTDLGALSSRLLELSAKTNTVEPYKITDTLSIRQTRKRRDDLHVAYTDIVSGTQEMQALINRARSLPEPVQPVEGVIVTDEEAAALDAYKAQMDAMDKRADELGLAIKDATDRHSRAFFGDAYDEVMELSADWDAEFFDAVKADINDHFMAAVHAPADGRDDDGAIVDAVEAVEAGKSQT